MKKIIIAAALAAFIVPMTATAEVTLFGTMEGAVEMYSGDADGSDVVFGDSEVGIKVTEDLGNGTSVFGMFTFDINGEESGAGIRGVNGTGSALEVDQMYMGLTNSTFGTARIGRYDTMAAGIGDATIDQFEGRSNDFTFSGVYGNGVNYITPTFNGFQGAVSLVMDGDNTGVPGNEDNVDLQEYRVTYEGNSAYVGIGYATGSTVAQDTFIPALDDVEVVTVGAAYTFGGENNWRVNAGYEQIDVNVAGIDDAQNWTVGGAADFGNNTVLVGYQSQDWGTLADADIYTVEGQHHFSKRTKVYVNYQQNNDNATNVDYGVFGMGMRHDF